MDERTLARTAGFAALQANLSRMLAAIAGYVRAHV
jgi:hypothetical protein